MKNINILYNITKKWEHAMEEELVDYLKEGKNVFLKSIFNTRDIALDSWKGSKAFSKVGKCEGELQN